MYYNECPYCGANLDPGERCECEAERLRGQSIRKRHHRDLIEYMNELEEKRNEQFAV